MTENNKNNDKKEHRNRLLDDMFNPPPLNQNVNVGRNRSFPIELEGEKRNEKKRELRVDVVKGTQGNRRIIINDESGAVVIYEGEVEMIVKALKKTKKRLDRGYGLISEEKKDD